MSIKEQNAGHPAILGRGQTMLIEHLNCFPYSVLMVNDLVDGFNAASAGGLAERMGIVITAAEPGRVEATMPVEGNTQPYGLLHGGASAALAETIGSIAGAIHAGPSRMIVGVDLRKDAAMLERAYDDSEGVTARFSLNVLARANREAGADFDLARFRHRARYHSGTGQVEIDLVSLADQRARIGDHCFTLAAGEAIHVEDSWKFLVEDFQGLARAAGFNPGQVWTDPARLFSVHLLEVAP
jgi:uncharacterized protein (TIGR00369 family)